MSYVMQFCFIEDTWRSCITVTKEHGLISLFLSSYCKLKWKLTGTSNQCLNRWMWDEITAYFIITWSILHLFVSVHQDLKLFQLLLFSTTIHNMWYFWTWNIQLIGSSKVWEEHDENVFKLGNKIFEYEKTNKT